MEGLRTDLGMGVLSGSQTDVSKASSDMGGKITALDKAIKEIQATNNERRKIVSDLQAAMRLHKGTFYREPDIASADKTVKATDKLYSQYRQLLDIVEQEQDWYDKYLAGQPNMVAMTNSLVDLKTKYNKLAADLNTLEAGITQGNRPVY